MRIDQALLQGTFQDDKMTFLSTHVVEHTIATTDSGPEHRHSVHQSKVLKPIHE